MLETLMMINGSIVSIVVVHLLVYNSCALAVWDAVVAGWSRLYNMCRVIVIFLDTFASIKSVLSYYFPAGKVTGCLCLLLKTRRRPPIGTEYVLVREILNIVLMIDFQKGQDPKNMIRQISSFSSFYIPGGCF